MLYHPCITVIIHRRHDSAPTKPYRLHQKILELINEFGKVAGYKINVHKSMAFLYTNNALSERETKKTIPFTVATNKI